LGVRFRIESDSTVPGTIGSEPVQRLSPFFGREGVTAQGVWRCGTNAATRRIVLDRGVLVLRGVAIRCPTESGPDITGTYEVDGLSSTGIFAGARGTGSDTVDTRSHTSTLSGKLKLAGSDD
jgi:hypothetical protein